MSNVISTRDEPSRVFPEAINAPQMVRELTAAEVLSVAGAATTTEYAILIS